MSVRLYITRFLQHGKIFFRSIRPHQEVGKINILPQGGKIEAAKNSVSPPNTGVFGLPSHLSSARKLFVDNVLKRVTNSLATELRRKTTKQLLSGNSAPFFALVGVSLASGTGIITKEDELDGVCWEIREAVRKMHQNMFQVETEMFDQETASFEKLEVGPKIAKGSNAVVYAARQKEDPLSETFHTQEPIEGFPYAVKMMFNYDAESNASAILRSMYCETVPARVHYSNSELIEWEQSMEEHAVVLPPHPNIVAMHCVFADWVPSIPGAISDYPDALPSRLNPDGSGRNMSLFLLMKRYDCSLKEYLREQKPDVREAILLLTQLLEAVAHMTKYGVAHRDLKSDNVLLDLSEGSGSCPMLAVSDFGCCLADRTVGLSMPFRTLDTNRGGNAALMAPEVACATPGLFTYIDYSKSDAWAVGTIAYELMSEQGNPFYRSASTGAILRNTSYTDTDLPPLDDAVPPVVSRLVHDLLARNPNQRPSAEVAATVCQLFLWAPTSWLNPLHTRALPSSSEILQWLLCLTTKVLCEGRLQGVTGARRTATEYQLIACFLQRAKLSIIRQALNWIHLR
ncbi:serine/threonine-protein kinase Pink1, mitochondrial [Homalodisca vitripennis]|uniref:serine/threonine-protein kinase Pink1, mitochondrial n=1 Tax=Homalodisca vitripennis TaxID=197043 RepID=UPI001EEAB37E|nr:serine/threonine-protein kinase Pink1, mitochondrial [Homalodisca vitripennis]